MVVTVTPETITSNKQTNLRIDIELNKPAAAGSKCFIFTDIRQDAGLWQTETPAAENYLKVQDGRETIVEATCARMRTLDLYPLVPEFLALCTLDLPELAAGSLITLEIPDWHAPERPIDSYRFWVVPDLEAQFNFPPTGYRTYREFVFRSTSDRVPFSMLEALLEVAKVRVEGNYAPIPVQNKRKTPGIYWGELHGMSFNQRKIDDFYEYAKRETELDFCSAIQFSYNTCVDDVWNEVKRANARHLEPGKFVPILAFECGTPPDDSHRVAYFINKTDVPPIFCDSRPPANDPHLHSRFRSDTIVCSNLDEFYKTVDRFNGFVGGHFHTLRYHQERLAELWQKQEFRDTYQKNKPFADEEQNVYELLKAGMKLGFTGGSDTHDSMPGNPYPEPGCPRPAGFTGILADELTPEAIDQALRSRRTIATSGARIGIWLTYGDARIGDITAFKTDTPFRIRVDGATELRSVELLRNGAVFATWEERPGQFETEMIPEPVPSTGEDFYHLRVTQVDEHIGWASPIWLHPIADL